jgi:hypothetical protein
MKKSSERKAYALRGNLALAKYDKDPEQIDKRMKKKELVDFA